MISRSVAQIATASMRTSTSARLGTGTGFCFKVSSPGSPSTHARMLSGIGWSGLVFTPAGAYMASPLVIRPADQGRRLGYMTATFERYNYRKPGVDPGRLRVPREMPDHAISTMSICDCRIRVMRGGTGTPMLFLHGAGGAGAWLPFMARLAKKFDLIVPEHPGFGESDTPPWLDNIADLANFYLDFLDQLDLT